MQNRMCGVVGIVLALAVSLSGQTRAGTEDVVVLAADVSESSSNVKPADPAYSHLAVSHGLKGMMQWEAVVGGPGGYSGPENLYIHWRMCSEESRPCRLTINGKVLDDRALGQTTGGFKAEHLAWVTTGPFPLEKGKQTIRLEASEYMPHFRGFVVSASPKPPKGSPFERLEQQRKEEALEAERRRRREINQTVGAETRRKLRELLPGVEQLFFVRRYTLQSSHYYTDFIDGCVYFGGALCLLSLDDGSVQPIVPGPVAGNELEGGIFGRCNLSFDG